MNCKSPDPKRWRRRRELDRFLKNEWKIIPIDSSLCWIWTRYKGRQRWKSLIMAAWFPVFDGWLQSNFCLFNLPFVTTYISAYLLLKLSKVNFMKDVYKIFCRFTIFIRMFKLQSPPLKLNFRYAMRCHFKLEIPKKSECSLCSVIKY